MTDKKLTSNVEVGGVWYGPSYGNADKAPFDKITNPAAYATPAVETGSGDLRFRADDFGVESGEQPNLRTQAEEAEQQRAEAEQAGRDEIFATSAPSRRSQSASKRQG